MSHRIIVHLKHLGRVAVLGLLLHAWLVDVASAVPTTYGPPDTCPSTTPCCSDKSRDPLCFCTRNC